MVDNVTGILKALADPSRRRIFHTLIVVAASLPITQVVAQFDMSRQGVTKHLKILESAGLVEISAQGRERFCKANALPLKELKKWLVFYDKFWDESLNNLSSYLSEKN